MFKRRRSVAGQRLLLLLVAVGSWLAVSAAVRGSGRGDAQGLRGLLGFSEAILGPGLSADRRTFASSGPRLVRGSNRGDSGKSVGGESAATGIQHSATHAGSPAS